MHPPFVDHLRLFLIACWMICWFPASLVAQQELTISKLSVEDGLTDREVNFTTRGPLGFLWLVSSGIERYDGRDFLRYSRFDSLRTLPVSDITTAVRYDEDNVLFTAGKELHLFSLRTGASRPHAMPEGMDTGFTDIFQLIGDDAASDRLIITGGAGFLTVHLIDRAWRERLRYRVPDESPLYVSLQRSYANGPAGTLWLLDGSGAQVLRIRAGGVDSIPLPLAPDGSFPQHRIAYHPAHGLAVFGSHGVAYRIAPDGDRAETTLTLPPTDGMLYAMHFAREGTLWVAHPKGFYLIDPSRGTARIFGKTLFGPTPYIIYHYFEDAEGAMWYATELGVFRVSIGKPPFQPMLAEPEGEVNRQFREIIPYGQRDTFLVRSHREQTELSRLVLLPNGEEEFQLLSTEVLRRGLVQHHGGNLYHIDPEEGELLIFEPRGQRMSKRPLPIPASTNYRGQFAFDGNGVLHYADRDKNIVRWDLSTDAVSTLTLAPLPQSASMEMLVFVITEDTYVVGYTYDGLAVYNRADGKLLRYLSTRSRPALSNDRVSAIYVDGDSLLWIGTLGGGVNRLDTRTNRMEYMTTANGLPNNLVASITAGRENVWVGTYDGLARFGRRVNRPLQSYGAADGLSHPEFNYRSGCLAPDGSLLLGTLNGITRVFPDAITGQRPIPSVRLTRWQLYNRRTKRQREEVVHHSVPAELTVSPYDNYLQLHFGVPAYGSPGEPEYLIRWDDEDRWRSLERNNFVRLQNIPVGHPTLWVKARDATGNESAAPLRIRLDVQPIFYRTWWFTLLIVGGFLLAVYAVFRYRLRTVQREMDTRTRIASDLHDEVGSSLTTVSYQLQMMDGGGDNDTPMNRLSHEIDDAAGKLRDVLWAVDARNDRWEQVIGRMVDYASDILHPRGIDFTLRHEGSPPSGNIPPAWKQNVYLIFKEAIHNVARHSNGDRVTIVLTSHGARHLTLIVEDNGTAPTDHDPGSGQGLANLHLRARRLNGSLTAGFTDRGFRVHLGI